MKSRKLDSVETKCKMKKAEIGRYNGRHICDGRYSVNTSATGVMMKITKVTITGS